MNWKRLNNNLHRDLGYFFMFLIIIYSISGIAINHSADWNPDFYIRKKSLKLNLPSEPKSITKEMVLSELEKAGEQQEYLMHEFPSESKLKVYYKNGSLMYNLNEGLGELEIVTKRHLLYEMNYLHRNPGGLWTWISDFFAMCLIFLSVSGLFVLRGKNGLKGRGKWLAGAGTAITIVFVFLLI